MSLNELAIHDIDVDVCLAEKNTCVTRLRFNVSDR